MKKIKRFNIEMNSRVLNAPVEGVCIEKPNNGNREQKEETLFCGILPLYFENSSIIVFLSLHTILAMFDSHFNPVLEAKLDDFCLYFLEQ